MHTEKEEREVKELAENNRTILTRIGSNPIFETFEKLRFQFYMVFSQPKYK